MSWQDIGETLLYAIVNSTVIAFVLKLIFEKSLDNLSNRLTQNHQLALDKMLEDKKANNERKNYVSKVRFDKEFEIYQDLIKNTLRFQSHANFFIYKANGIFDSKTTTEVFIKLIESYSIMETSMYESASFIPENIYTHYQSYYKIAHNIASEAEEIIKLLEKNLDPSYSNYSDEISKLAIVMEENQKSSSDLVELIIKDTRKYLENLEVNE